MIPSTGSMPRKEAPEETSNSACKGVPGLEERISIMRKLSIINQVVDDQERDDQQDVVKKMQTNKIYRPTNSFILVEDNLHQPKPDRTFIAGKMMAFGSCLEVV